MEYIELLLIFGLGFFLGFRISDALMKYTFKKMIEEAGLSSKDVEKFAAHHAKILGGSLDESTDEDGYKKVDIKIEKHGDALYAFRKDDDQFLGQGIDKEDLIRRLGEKLRGVRLIIDEADGAEYIKGSYQFDCNTNEIKER